MAGEITVGKGRGVGVAVTREVDRDERPLEGQGDGVEGVRVLPPAVHEGEPVRFVAPRQAAELSQSIDGHEESSNDRYASGQPPFSDVLPKVRKLVVVTVVVFVVRLFWRRHATHFRR